MTLQNKWWANKEYYLKGIIRRKGKVQQLQAFQVFLKRVDEIIKDIESLKKNLINPRESVSSVEDIM